LNCSVVHYYLYVHVHVLYIPNAYSAQKCYRCFYWEFTTSRVKVPQLLLFICIKQYNHILYEQCTGPNCDHEEYPLGTACGNLLINFRSSLAPYQALALYPSLSLQHLSLAVAPNVWKAWYNSSHAVTYLDVGWTFGRMALSWIICK